MNQCRKIEPLIHLYRSGELSDADTVDVAEHTKTCSRCREVLRQLHSIDAALVPLRMSVPDISGNSALAEDTMNRITRRSLKRAVRLSSVGALDELFGRLRPVLSFAMLAAALLFGGQQSRDASKVSALERQMGRQGDVAMSSDVFVGSEARRLVEIAELAQERGSSFSPSLQGATMAVDPTELLRGGILGIFRHNNGLFDELSRRYPDLSSVTLSDGIDEREKKILETEGKALLIDLEQLLHEGEK